MKVVFMGTPEIAATVLEAIIKSKHEVILCVTQQDKPSGRGKELKKPAVKEMAEKYNIPVFQPKILKCEESVAELKKYPADIFVVAAYGKILSKEILDMPEYGCINVHASLLPKYRGAAPIQWSIIEGEKLTGVTIMQMSEGLDTGDMLFKSVVEINADDTADTLYERLSKCGGELITEALDRIEAGDIHPIPQEESLATYAKIIDKSMGHISFKQGAEAIERLVRGLNSWPGTFAYINGKMIKIWEARVSVVPSEGEPGTVNSTENGRLLINTTDKCLEVLTIQLEGKKRMDVKSFLLGFKIEKGDVLS